MEMPTKPLQPSSPLGGKTWPIEAGPSLRTAAHWAGAASIDHNSVIAGRVFPLTVGFSNPETRCQHSQLFPTSQQLSPALLQTWRPLKGSLL